MYQLNPHMEDILKEFQEKIPRDALYGKLLRLMKQYALYELLARMGVIASEYQTIARSEREDMYWDKSWRALINLSRGELKWYLESEEGEEV